MVAPVPADRGGPSARGAWRRRIAVVCAAMAILGVALGGSVLGFRRTGPIAARLQWFLGEWDASDSHEALTMWTWVTRVSPGSAEAHDRRGMALFDLGRDEDALRALDRAVALHAKEAFYYYHRGLVLTRLERYEEALSDLDRAVQLQPEDDRLREARDGARQQLSGSNHAAAETRADAP